MYKRQSSTTAIIQTLETLKERLESLQNRHQVEQDWLERLLADESLDEELLEAAEADEVEEADARYLEQEVNPTRLQGEIAEIEQYLSLARGIHEDAKSHALARMLHRADQTLPGFRPGECDPSPGLKLAIY